MNPLRLLLVDDDEGDLLLVQEALALSPVRLSIDVAHDGVEALDVLRQRPPYASVRRPDLVLLDLNMPRMNGIETLEEIRRDESLRSLPVVVLTTSDAERDVAACYGLNANSYVSKPDTLAGFVEAMRTLSGFWFELVSLPGRDTWGSAPAS